MISSPRAIFFKDWAMTILPFGVEKVPNFSQPPDAKVDIVRTIGDPT
jgi:hypothetical protein